MGISRRQAIKRINGLSGQIHVHLAKIRDGESSELKRHWRAEIESWIGQVERLARHVGTTGRAEILARVGGWRRELEAGDERE